MTTSEILRLARAYADYWGVTLSTAGVHSCRNNDVFQRLAEGGTARTRTIETAAMWFARNWPADLEWPSDIKRKRGKRRPQGRPTQANNDPERQRG